MSWEKRDEVSSDFKTQKYTPTARVDSPSVRPCARCLQYVRSHVILPMDTDPPGGVECFSAPSLIQFLEKWKCIYFVFTQQLPTKLISSSQFNRYV